LYVALAADHRGVSLKAQLIERLQADGHELLDLGVHDTTPADYPDVARWVGDALRDHRAERGIVVCGSGVGACIAANKIEGIRAGICHDTYSAHQGVEHDDMNVLCLGSEIVGPALAEEIAQAFLAARFNTSEERYSRRLEKLADIERLRR
jgi:ribose 5-phosphate isomerase B